eukprot:jgi/Mesvir1/23218/Mv22676-RA.1
MADMARLSLQERIKLHSDFFNRLVDCVPAKFYIPKEEPDDASGPFKRGKKSISAKLAAKKEGKKAKRARLDPLASVNTVEAVRLKKAKEAEAAALAKEREGDGGEGHEGGSNSDRGGAPGNAGEPAPKRAMSHEELKQRLHQRIEEMRARRHAEKAEDSKKRKAEEAKSWRKQAEGAARKKPRGEPDKPTTGGAGGQDQGTLAGVAGVNGIIPRPKGGLTSTQALKATVEATLRSEAGGGMVFPQMVATPGNVDELLEERWQQRQQKKKGGDKAHALQKAIKLKEKIATLPQGQQIAEKASWDAALKKAAGEKVLNDPTLLKKSLKREAKLKEKRKAKWKERLSAQEEEMKQAQQKRNSNLKARADLKKENQVNKALGLKKKKKPSRPGFEGRKQGYINN